MDLFAVLNAQMQTVREDRVVAAFSTALLRLTSDNEHSRQFEKGEETMPHRWF